MQKSKEKVIKRWCCIALSIVMVMGASLPAMAAGSGRITHGTAKQWITENQLNNTPPADYKVNKKTQGDAKDGEYNKYFLKDGIQTVHIEIEENNLNYLLQNAIDEPYVMTTSVTIGDTKLGYCGLKTKGAYTLEHAYTDNPGSDRFSFTVNFGKYIKKAEYGEKQNFYGANKISFNNFFFDKSMMKEFTALTLLKEMGLPTPQFGLAKLYINNQYYGVYAMIETYDESILEQYYGVDDKELSSYMTKPEGTLFHYDAIMEDDSPLWEYDEDTYKDVEDMLPTVKEWVRKLNCLSEGTDFDGNEIDYNSDQYLELLNQILDVEEVIRYFAAHSWLCQLDSMFSGQKNFGLYVDTDGKALIVPWDYDLSYGCYYPSTAQLTANYEIDALYMLAGWGQDMSRYPVTKDSYKRYPLFNVIFKNDELMAKYHEYMKDCSKIAALGGTTTATGKSYDPGYIASFVEALEDDIIDAATEKLASNVYYMNFTNQPRDVKQGLPNLVKIIAMRAVGVLMQVDGMNGVVCGAGCDLGTLGNGSMGEHETRGRLALVHSSGMFVTAEFESRGSRSNLVLAMKELESGDDDYKNVASAIGVSSNDSLDVYDLNISVKATTDYQVTIPLEKVRLERNGDIKIYSYSKGELTEVTPSVSGNLYTVTLSDVDIIAVMQVNGNLPYDPVVVMIIAIVAVVVVAAVVVVLVILKKKKKATKNAGAAENVIEEATDGVTTEEENPIEDVDSDKSTEQ